MMSSPAGANLQTRLQIVDRPPGRQVIVASLADWRAG
jgi:hypothetical protein